MVDPTLEDIRRRDAVIVHMIDTERMTMTAVLTLSCFLTFLPPFALPAFLLGFTIAPEPKFTRRSVSRALESSHWCQSPWTRCVTAEAKIDFSLNNFLRRGGGGPTADWSVVRNSAEFRASMHNQSADLAP